ncbi:MAG: ankyrin repeat domain-containing protein [Firmicutes bacterium]|nr:ankyrin repeat domain-containing protein [Bacillota bacterium]
MIKTFKAIRRGDIEAVREILLAKPEEINAVAKQPPKKDDGQSLLQVALKTGQLDIAELLLDYNADVNFMESEECCNEWRAPVLHDAIMRAVNNCRYNVKKYSSNEYEVCSTKERADKAFYILERMLEMGADIKAKDSYGNSTLARAVLDARQILPSYVYTSNTLCNDRIVTKEVREDLTRIFRLLYEYGADSQWPDRISGRTMADEYKKEPVAEFLNMDILTTKKRTLFDRIFKR